MATLPENPDGTDLEHLVAAHFASRACFVESGVTERTPDDVSDIDVVWTDYKQRPATPHPVEAKSGAWRLDDLFKFYGWTKYLRLEPGQFAFTATPEKPDKIQRVADRMGVQLLHVDRANVDAAFATLGLPDPEHPWLPSLWRFSYRARSRYFAALQEAIRQKTCRESAIRAKEYRRLVNDALFFEQDPRKRLSMLLQAHRGHRSLASTAAAEIEGKTPDFEGGPSTTRAFKEALYRGKHFPVQACFYLTHRARLYVLKAAVDTRLAHEAGEIREMILKINGEELNLGIGIPSSRFAAAIEHFAKHDWFPSLPTFWQVFLWGWGGFILDDRIDQERASLSAQTGIPENAVEEALTAFEQFFGDKFGFHRAPSDTRRIVPLTPAALRGVGAVHRLWREKAEKYMALGFADNTAYRMAQDHQALVGLLESDARGLAV